MIGKIPKVLSFSSPLGWRVLEADAIHPHTACYFGVIPAHFRIAVLKRRETDGCVHMQSMPDKPYRVMIEVVTDSRWSRWGLIQLHHGERTM